MHCQQLNSYKPEFNRSGVSVRQISDTTFKVKQTLTGTKVEALGMLTIRSLQRNPAVGVFSSHGAGAEEPDWGGWKSTQRGLPC